MIPFSSMVDNEKVVELPLNGRSFTQLTILIPGAVAGAGGLTAFQTTGTAVSISGPRSAANNYTLDGANSNEIFFKTYGLQPSVDAIQKSKIPTNITSAQFGTAAEANVNVVTKPGTIEVRGTVFEFPGIGCHLDRGAVFARSSHQLRRTPRAAGA